MNTFANDLKDAVYDSIMDILLAKGIEDKICTKVAKDIVNLFEHKIIKKQQDVMLAEYVSVVKNAITEADKQFSTGPN